jgi:hypothetical protein
VSRKEILISSEIFASWLFLMFNLPAKHASERVKVWRRLKKFGAVQLKTSTYVLPDEPVHYERFQWLAKEIDDGGGEATLVRVKDIEGMRMRRWSHCSMRPALGTRTRLSSF